MEQIDHLHDILTETIERGTITEVVREAIDRARESMSPAQRKILSLYCKGIKKYEIAGELGLSPSKISKEWYRICNLVVRELKNLGVHGNEKFIIYESNQTEAEILFNSLFGSRRDRLHTQ